MALLGISLILASVVLFCMRRPVWLPAILGGAPRPPIEPPAPARSECESADRASDADAITRDGSDHDSRRADGEKPNQSPIFSPPIVRHPAPESDQGAHSSEDGEQTTPKASAATPDNPVPALALSVPESAPAASQPNGADRGPSTAPTAASTLMPPPPRPPTLRPSRRDNLSPSLAPPRARNLPLPARGPGCSTLAPPPTHSSVPAKPSRAVVLSPGHSPLDWARLSGHPTADLRGLPPGTPYLRVTPSMLKKMTGRKGKDAWMVLGGRVYNITPYLPFHPGGEPELLRGAGRDGTRLFGEIHPWVNYEGMLAACLVGIYVPEEEGGDVGTAAAGGGARDMEAMD
ncbi:hypothetical protein L209DRAFT_730393 [Thermothelomyces heterothallicus CBS 203.75]